MSDIWNPVNWVEALIRFLDWLGSRVTEVTIFWFVSAFVCAIRFLPASWLVLAGLNVQNHRYVAWSDWSLGVSTVYLLVFGGAELVRRASVRKHLYRLASDEKGVLVNRFLTPNVSTVLAFPHEPGFTSLVDAGVLKMSMTDFKQGEQMGVYRFTPRIERYIAKRRTAILRRIG